MRVTARRLLLCVLAAAATSCGSGPEAGGQPAAGEGGSAAERQGPPTAHWNVVEMLRESLELEHARQMDFTGRTM